MHWVTRLFFFGIAIQATVTSADDVFVNGRHGLDTNDGATPDTAVKTPSRGLSLCNPGDILHLDPAGSPYADSLAFGNRGGLPGRPITVEGNDSVLTGLQTLPVDKWQDRGNDLWFFPNTMRRGSLRPFLVTGNGDHVPQGGPEPEMLEPGSAVWVGDGVWFRLPPRTTLTALGLRGTMRASGVALSGASHVTIRNLVCEHFANDGFNIHGSCYGLIFTDIESRHNGDDGFSVHEDVGATVHGAWLHHNSFGIQDVNASRSMYSGVLSEHNRLHGIHFAGGMHSVTDSLVRDNGSDQIRIEGGTANHMQLRNDHPMLAGTVYLSNVAALGGRTGITVGAGSRASLRHCTVLASGTGLQILKDATAHVDRSAIVRCRDRALHCESAHAVLNHNLYSPSQIRWLDTVVAAGQFGEYRSRSGQDAQSVAQSPLYTGPAAFTIASPRVMVGDRLLAPGVRSEPALPFGTTVQNPFADDLEIDLVSPGAND